MKENLIIIILIIAILFLTVRKSSYSIESKQYLPSIAYLTDAQFTYTLFYMEGANRPTAHQVFPTGTQIPASKWACQNKDGNSDCWDWTLPYDTTKTYNKLQDFCTIAINQIKGTNSYDLINKYLPDATLKYSSDADLNSVFDSAYTNGEPKGTTREDIRDRTMLHMVAYIYTGLSTRMPGIGGFTFPDNGRVSWTSEVMSETGKTANEVIALGYEITQKFLLPKYYMVDISAAVTYINSVLPSNLNRYYIPDGLSSSFTPNGGFVDYNTSASLNFTNQDSYLHPENKDRWPWLCKVASIGTVYVAYLVKEKWKLDMNWIPPGFPTLDTITIQYLNKDTSSSVDFSSLNFTTSYGTGSGSGSGSGSG